jgi:hypothetical protein
MKLTAPIINAGTVLDHRDGGHSSFKALANGLDANSDHVLGDTYQPGVNGLINHALLFRAKLNGHVRPPLLLFHCTNWKAMRMGNAGEVKGVPQGLKPTILLGPKRHD